MPPKKQPYIYVGEHTLVIVESPSKCKKIESILGDNYKVVASRGHIYEISGLKSISTRTDFAPKYSVIAAKIKIVEELRAQIRAAAAVILATDADREGEAIAHHIMLEFGLPADTPRIVFHEITAPAILAAVAAPRTIDMNLVMAQQARAVLDCIVGYKISPLLWKYVPRAAAVSASAGRCQTPALRVIWDHARERAAAAPAETKYKVQGFFFDQNFPFSLTDSPPDPAEFLRASAAWDHKVLSVVPAVRTHQPPAPFHTSSLIQASSYSPKETMSICQSLYQGGYITYMRTDNRKLSPPFLAAARKYITAQYGTAAVGDLGAITTVAGQKESHEAIRPTHIETADLPATFTARHKAIYRLIRLRTIEACMAAAKMDAVSLTISAPQAGKYEFSAETPLTGAAGWKAVAGAAGGADTVSFLKRAVAGTSIKWNFIQATVMPDAPRNPYYNETSLVRKLEQLGIGRPSTFASLVDVIQTREYVVKKDVDGTIIDTVDYTLRAGETEPTAAATQKEFGREKNKLVIRAGGEQVLDFLLRHFEALFSYEYTARMEERLDKVAAGEETWNTICRECYQFIKDQMNPLTTAAKRRYMLDERHEVVFTMRGPAIQYTAPDGTTSLKNIKPEAQLSLFRLAEGQYRLDDLLLLDNDCLGEYEGEPLYIKSGRYGLYVTWGEKKHSLNGMKKSADEITLADVVAHITNPAPVAGLLRQVTPELCIKKGRFGAYLELTRGGGEEKVTKSLKGFKGSIYAASAADLSEWAFKPRAAGRGRPKKAEK